MVTLQKKLREEKQILKAEQVDIIISALRYYYFSIRQGSQRDELEFILRKFQDYHVHQNVYDNEINLYLPPRG